MAISHSAPILARNQSPADLERMARKRRKLALAKRRKQARLSRALAWADYHSAEYREPTDYPCILVKF